ncbi:MAG TPA: Bax inhibitor-1/YccA family protein [Candidatus Limnocylindrales bacterium]|jgi:FtsH-binding integral membrane protein|nr:Bax inhibitor-1/YccA family protein [Candidatus Limnocylindrales bacterium]
MTVNPQSPTQLGVRPAPALVQQLLVGAFGWMFAGLLLSAGVAYLVGTSEQLLNTVAQWWLPLLIGQFILVMVISAGINKLSATAALGLFFLYAATMGLTIGVIVWAYMQTPGGSTAVASAFLSASAMFAGAAVYGAVTKRELAKLGGLLFMALIGLIVASVVNLFLHSSSVDWVISIAGVLIFVGLTAYDVQRITRGDYAAFTQSKEKASVLAALHLYLNFINLFLFLLRIFGGNRG